MAANNPMVPPMDPRAMAAMGMPNPFAPPEPPPPSPSLGFQVWASDPRNAHKVQPAMTAPDAPLQPNHPQMASANPPQPAPMASAAPPANVTAPVNLPQAPAPSMPSAQPAARSQEDVDRAKLNQYQTEGAGLNKIHNGFLRGLARVGDVAESIVAPGIAALTPGTTNHNLLLQNRQQGRVANDQAALQASNQQQQFQTQQQLNQANLEHTQAETQKLQNPTPEKPENIQQLYSDAVADAMGRGVDPNKDPKVMQLADAVTGLQRQPAPKEQAKDDRAIAIYAKPPAQRTAEENAYLKGYETYVQKTKVEPGVARTSVLLQMPTAVADPNNPGSVIYTTRKGAIGQGAPQGIDTQVPLSSAKDMTSGVDSHTITAGNTLSHHLDLYDQAVDAVHNGDTQLINRIGNEFGIQLGSDAQTNLALIRQGVAMEAARYWTGGVPGEAEINQFNKSLSGDGSPRQMHGGANTVRAMAKGKLQGLQGQYGSGMQGKPNFGNPMQPPTQGGPNGVQVLTDGGTTYHIPTAQVAAFKKDHPNAR